MKQLSILIPVYNEQKTIAKVLGKLLKLEFLGWKKNLIVINDASTDETEKILKRFARKGVVVLTHEKNQGKTMAIKTGIKKATGQYIIIQDADLEYDPEDIKLLLEKTAPDLSNAVYGSRFKGKHVDTVLGHKTGNQMLTTLTNLLYGSHISDMETCYKLIPAKIFKSIRIETSRFSFEPEITAKLIKLKVPIIEVPISYSKRSVTEGKSLRWWKDGWSAVWTLVKYRFMK